MRNAPPSRSDDGAWIDAPSGQVTIQICPELDADVDVDEGVATLKAVYVGNVKITDTALLKEFEKHCIGLDEHAQEALER